LLTEVSEKLCEKQSSEEKVWFKKRDAGREHGRAGGKFLNDKDRKKGVGVEKGGERKKGGRRKKNPLIPPRPPVNP